MKKLIVIFVLYIFILLNLYSDEVKDVSLFFIDKRICKIIVNKTDGKPFTLSRYEKDKNIINVYTFNYYNNEERLSRSYIYNNNIIRIKNFTKNNLAMERIITYDENNKIKSINCKDYYFSNRDKESVYYDRNYYYNGDKIDYIDIKSDYLLLKRINYYYRNEYIDYKEYIFKDCKIVTSKFEFIDNANFSIMNPLDFESPRYRLDHREEISEDGYKVIKEYIYWFEEDIKDNNAEVLIQKWDKDKLLEYITPNEKYIFYYE